MRNVNVEMKNVGALNVIKRSENYSESPFIHFSFKFLITHFSFLI